MHPVPLVRSFIAVPEAYQHDDLPLDDVRESLVRGKRIQWPNLLTQHRVIILAEAGAGKTFELRATANRLGVDGKRAFFIRIEDIDVDFEDSFEVGTSQDFKDWLRGDDEAWFFLDSVDEVRLTEPRAFERALRAFARRIHPATQRAHIYISGRPYAWRSVADRTLIEEILPFDPPRLEPTGIDNLEVPAPKAADSSPTVLLYLLASLEEPDVRLFAEQRGITDLPGFLDALDRGALQPLARSPFDLEDLIASWLAGDTLDSRLRVMRAGLHRHLRRLSDNSALNVPGFDDALDAVRLLAVAVILTGRQNIALPSALGSSTAIRVESLLEGWSEQAITALLNCGVFSEPIFSQIRFRHREARELLAAEWFCGHLARQGAREQLNMLLFRDIYGEEILPPRLHPILPWLVLFDAEIRQRILAVHPEIAVEGGDAASLPVDVRQALLDTLVQRVIEPDSGLRGLDNAAIARIAQPDLEDRVLKLIEIHVANDDAIFLLGRLVWQGALGGCVPALAPIASDTSRGIYARIASARAVACVGSEADQYRVWGAIIDEGSPLARRLLTEIVTNASPTARTVALLLASIEILDAPEQFEASGLSHALHGLVDRFPVGPPEPDEEPLLALATGLLVFLRREPFVNKGDCEVSKAFQWLMGIALHCIERLIVARSPAALSPVSLNILSDAPVLRFWGEHEYQERKTRIEELVPGWQELNDALFWWLIETRRPIVEDKGEKLDDDWSVSFIGHFFSFDADSFERTIDWVRTRSLDDDKKIALNRSIRTFFAAERPGGWEKSLREVVAGRTDLEAIIDAKLNAKPSPQAVRFEQYEKKRAREEKARDKKKSKDRHWFVETLRADPDAIRHPPGLKPGTLTSWQFNLLQVIEGSGMRSSRAQGANWEALIPEFGRDVAEAYRDAALAQWRAFKPGLRSEGDDTSQIPYALIFAMAGLDIDLAAPNADLPKLSRRDVGRALHYVVWEMNGFPRWFEALYRRRPVASRNFLWKEIEWDLRNSPSGQPFIYVLHHVVYYGAWLQADLGPLIWNWLQANHAANLDCLRYCRTIMVQGGVAATDIANLARSKLANPTTPDAQLAVWQAMWTDADPPPAIQRMSESFTTGTPPTTSFMSAFSIALLGGRREVSPIFGNFRAPTSLKQLYILMHRSVRVADDIQRAGKGVYSPTPRDDAQDARNRLFEMLAEIPGEQTYTAIIQLTQTHPESGYRGWMRVRATGRAVVDGDLPAWTEEEVAKRSKSLSSLPLISGNGGLDATP